MITSQCELGAPMRQARSARCVSSSITSVCVWVQPFSQQSCPPCLAEVFLCGVVEAGLELFCNSWSAGFLRERLYVCMI